MQAVVRRALVRSMAGLRSRPRPFGLAGMLSVGDGLRLRIGQPAECLTACRDSVTAKSRIALPNHLRLPRIQPNT